MTASLEGVVVGGVDVGDHHRIARFLTAEHGRVDLMVYGARSSRGRWVGLLEVGTQLRVERRRSRGDLDVAAAAERIAAPRRARGELERIALLGYGCELCAALAPTDHSAHKLTRLLVTWLALLEGEATPGDASRVALEAKALTFAGLAPALVRCAVCGDPLDGAPMFSAEAGGAVHPRCGGGEPVPLEALIAAEHLRRTPLAATPPLPSPPGPRFLLAEFVEHQLGRALKSRAVLASLGP